MPLNLVTSGQDVPNNPNVIIEIPSRSVAGKWVKVEGWLGPEEPKAEILACIARYQAEPEKPQF